MEKNCKQDVMKMFHEIYKTTSLSRSISLRKAWEAYRLVLLLDHGVAKFTFRKSDGSIRTACGTRVNKAENAVQNKKRNYNTICFYDMEARDYRRFKIGNLISVY